MTVGARFQALNQIIRSHALRAPVSDHHFRACQELWPWLSDLGIRDALEVGAGEPPYLLTRMLRERGIACLTMDAVSECDVPGDAHAIPCANGGFDLVAARHVLEHVLCPYLVLSEMARVSRRWVLVVAPGLSEKTLNWPDHLWYLPAEGYGRMFRKLGLSVVRHEEGDHTEQHSLDAGLSPDREWRWLLSK